MTLAFRALATSRNSIVSFRGTRSDTTTAKVMPLSRASITAPLTKAGGTDITAASAGWSRSAWRTVS
jgi:hypothetical protein